MQPLTTEAEERRYPELQQMALDFARHGETASLAAMLEHGLPVDRSDARGNSLLMLASYNGQLDTARLLLGHGADLEADNGLGMTPLMFAAMFGRTSMVELLPSRGRRSNAGIASGFRPAFCRGWRGCGPACSTASDRARAMARAMGLD